MIKYLTIFLLLFNCYILADEKENRENQYIEILALTFQDFAGQEGESIWPRFHLTDRPAAFHFQNGHVYAFGLTKYSSLWEKRWIQQYPVLFCARYPVALAPLHPDFPLEKQHTFVFSLDHSNDGSFIPLLTFIHERFHIHQFQFFKKEKVVEAAAEDYQNLDLLAWMELEHRLLTLFLQTNEPEIKLEHLRDYVAVSQTRRQFLQPASIKWEDHQQKMEGLADYVSAKTFQVFPYIPDFNAEEFLLDMRKKKNKNLIYSAQDAIKGRHYFVGAVLGWALDFCGIKNWKEKIERGNTSLQLLLEKALYMQQEERYERLLFVQKVLGWTEIRAQICQQLEKEKQEQNEMIQAFEAQEGIVIKMGTPAGRMSSGGRHQKSCQVDNKRALMEDVSIAASQDQTWTLRFKSIPLVFEEQNGDRIFKLNRDTILYVDGNPISVEGILQNDQGEIPFSSLILKTEHCELNSQRPGKLYVEQESIFFKFK